MSVHKIKALRIATLFDENMPVIESKNKHNLENADTGDGSGKWWALAKTHLSGRPTGHTLVIESKLCPLDDGSILNSHNFRLIGGESFKSAIDAEKAIGEVIEVDEDGWFQWK